MGICVDADQRHGLTAGVGGPARSLRPGELAQASVMGALTAATAIIAVVLPHAGALGLLGAVPMGLLAYRYRIRVLVAATVAAAVIGFLVVGVSGVGAVALCAHVGGLGGFVKRRHRGMPTVIAVSFAAGVVIGAAAVIALTVLARLRELMFQAMSAALDGGVTVLNRVPHLRAAAQGFQTLFIEALAYWRWLVMNTPSSRRWGFADRLVGALLGAGAPRRYRRWRQTRRDRGRRADSARPDAAGRGVPALSRRRP